MAILGSRIWLLFRQLAKDRSEPRHKLPAGNARPKAAIRPSLRGASFDQPASTATVGWAVGRSLDLSRTSLPGPSPGTAPCIEMAMPSPSSHRSPDGRVTLSPRALLQVEALKNLACRGVPADSRCFPDLERGKKGTTTEARPEICSGTSEAACQSGGVTNWSS